MATKKYEATIIRLVEINKNETGRIRENLRTKATKEVALQVEEVVVVNVMVRSMDIILVIVQKSRRVKKLMQSWRNMKKKRRC